MDFLAIEASKTYTDRKIAAMGSLGGGGGGGVVDPGNNTINVVPTTSDPITVTGPNTTADMPWFGEGVFYHQDEFTPTRNIDGVLTFDFGSPEANADGEFYISTTDLRVGSDHNDTVQVDMYKSSGADRPFSLTAGTTYYLWWVDWSATVDLVIDRGPIFNRLKAYDLPGIVAADGVFVQRVHADTTVEWLRFPVPTGTIGASAEGWDTTASGMSSHAEGSRTEATGGSAHAEGITSKAQGLASHAENCSTATHDYSHAEGSAVSSGNYAHAENAALAVAAYSHAQGSAVANELYEDAMGHAWASHHTIPLLSNSRAVAENFFTPSPVNLFNGAPDNFTADSYRVIVSAFGPSSVVGLWEVKANVALVAGTPRLIGTPTVTALGDAGASSWTVQVSVTTIPSAGLKIACDSHGPMVRWGAVVKRDSFMSLAASDPLV